MGGEGVGEGVGEKNFGGFEVVGFNGGEVFLVFVEGVFGVCVVGNGDWVWWLGIMDVGCRGEDEFAERELKWGCV